jgi:hypothetical protein
MAARPSWWRGRCPWCSGQLGIRNVKVTLNNRFRCPFCRNSLRLHLWPLLLVVALVWAVFDLPVILYAWEPYASMWPIAFVCILDAFLFFAWLAPLFVRAPRSDSNAA